MLRRLLMVGLMTAGLLTTGAPAFAAPPVTETTTQKNLVETFVDIVPTSNCVEEGPLYTITPPATWSSTRPPSMTAA